MLPVEAVLDDGAFGVQFVEDDIGVGLVAGREDDDLPVAGEAFEEGDGVGRMLKLIYMLLPSIATPSFISGSHSPFSKQWMSVYSRQSMSVFLTLFFTVRGRWMLVAGLLDN